ncbi:unnamed protein product [Strongylus vulgaris]|uniref:Uncharacterized protein n=1 Tax=Strongylus vulgaris TaxID=40348 RepID=A0A3P7L5R1_STRVU|nr:unnamed protein product [Strongylus vulgaris]
MKGGGPAWELVVIPNGDRLLDQKTGDNFMVSCKVKDYDGAASDVKVEWYKDGNIVSRLGSIMTIYKTYANQLLINRPKIGDSGDYVCKAEVNGQEQQTTVKISFADPPKFINPQTEQHPEEGSTAEIVCLVEGTEKLEVFWQFNGTILEEGSPRGYEFQNDRQILLIPEYDSKKDDGIYKCNAAQFSSFETLAINVTGYSRPVITVFHAPENNTGFEGANAKIQCGAVGKPKPQYHWFHENGESISDSDKYKVHDGLLVIESLSEHDSGEYKCVASNEVGNATQTAELKVLLKPRVEKLLDITKKENDNVEVVCKYHGDGINSVKFVFGTEEYSVVDEEEGRELSPSDRSDNENNENGEEERDEGNEELNAENVDNDKEKVEDDGTEDEGEDDEEEDEAKENARIKRFEEDVTSERISVRAEDGSLILTIRNLTILNDEKRSYTLDPPILRRTSEDQFLLSRALHGFGSETEMRRVEADGSSIIIESVEGRSRLTLQNSAGRNYGSYTCKADNGVGIFTKAIEVIQTSNTLILIYFVILILVPPAIPEGIDCKKRLYPNYGKCSIGHELYSDYAQRPSRMEFQILEIGDSSLGDMDWDEARVISVDFGKATMNLFRLVPVLFPTTSSFSDAEEMVVRNLTPNTQYSVRARAINEAGESDFCQPTVMETTDPWAPKKPEHVRMECDQVCTVFWDEPNDHGSEITAYRVGIQEYIENEETGEEQNIGNAFTVEVGGEERSLELTHIRPHSSYRVSVSAINSIGVGEIEEIEVDTDDAPLSSTESFLTPKLPIIVGLSLLVILIIIDLICYSTNRCGLIACFCINCLGRAPRDRKKDVEAGRGENNRLLDNQASR